jgi:DNA end-binding protein Ku
VGVRVPLPAPRPRPRTATRRSASLARILPPIAGVPRSIWKGVITFGMVSIPVRLMTATEDKDVSFHLLHESDKSRIKFKRWCPVDDREVDNDELVRAFEVSKGQYVEITDEDLEKLPLPSKHTIELSAFVRSGEIDPIYHEKSYYLEPEETGLKPYTLLSKVLESKESVGVAKIALRNKEHLCALRPLDGTLVLDTLRYPDEIREHDEKLPNVLVSDREVDVAGSLVEALSEEFEPSKYRDQYREALLEVIASKSEGRQVVSPEAPKPEQVTDLMSALRASVEAARKKRPGGDEPTDKARAIREAAEARFESDEDRGKRAASKRKPASRAGARKPSAAKAHKGAPKRRTAA